MLIARLIVGADNATGVLAVDEIKEIVGSAFACSTFYPVAEGRWKGYKEACQVIEIWASNYDIEQQFQETVRSLARALAKQLQQDCVAVVFIQAEIDFIR